MTRGIGLGGRIVDISREITPMQVAALLAVKRAGMYAERIPIFASYGATPAYAGLITHKLVTWKRPKGWGPNWRMATITSLGEHVLLHVAELAMVAAGVMTDPCDAGGAADG